MNSSLRSIVSLSGQSVAYGLGWVGSRVISYLMLPLLTRHMSQEEYGAVSVITAIYFFLNTLTNAGLPSAIYRFHSESQDRETGRLILGTSQFLFILFAAVPALGIILFSNQISLLVLGSARYALAFQLAAGFLIVDTMNFFGTMILRIQVRPLAASTQGIVLVACETGMAVVFVVVFHMGASGYWLGFLIGEILGFLYTIWLVRASIVLRLSSKLAKALLRFGIPLIPSSLSITALRVADRYIIGSIAGLDQVAIYDVGYKIGSLIGLVFAPFVAAWMPFAFSIVNRPETPKVYRDVLTYLAAGTSFLILGVIAFRPELVNLMAPDTYAGAVPVVIWVAVSQLFWAAYQVLSIGPMIVKRTNLLLWPTVAAGVSNIVLDYLLIPVIGIIGAAIATFAGYLVLGVLVYIVCERSYPIPVDWRRLIQLLAASAAVFLFVLMVDRLQSAHWVRILAKSAGLLCFPLLLILFRFLTLEQGRAALAMGKNQLLRRLHVP